MMVSIVISSKFYVTLEHTESPVFANKLRIVYYKLSLVKPLIDLKVINFYWIRLYPLIENFQTHFKLPKRTLFNIISSTYNLC